MWVLSHFYMAPNDLRSIYQVFTVRIGRSFFFAPGLARTFSDSLTGFGPWTPAWRSLNSNAALGKLKEVKVNLVILLVELWFILYIFLKEIYATVISLCKLHWTQTISFSSVFNKKPTKLLSKTLVHPLPSLNITIYDLFSFFHTAKNAKSSKHFFYENFIFEVTVVKTWF